ncbi:hypothetical protein B0H13DRAFT_2319013 [Mycena leptocephala]|nr:hypothetical protein B0H13DRAFT_2319013 [Mycena leptocephala]
MPPRRGDLPDPVSTPPIINCAASTRAQAKGKAPMSSGSKGSSLPPSLATPTAASEARNVLAPLPKIAPSVAALPVSLHTWDKRESAIYLSAATGGPLPGSRSLSALSASANTSPSGTPLPTSSKSISELEFRESAEEDPEFSETRSETRVSSIAGSSLRGSPQIVENESVTAALASRVHAASAMEDGEPIFAAVQRYHGTYDPHSSSQEDPSFRTEPYAVMRYQYPSLNFEWSRLSELIERVMQMDATAVTIVPSADPQTQERFYSLNLGCLAAVGHAVIAVQQILEALTVFLRRDPSTSFSLDPSFGFTYMLELCASQKELRFALSTLQLRLYRADVHIRSYLLSIRETLTNEQYSERVSSVNSTVSEVRREFGGQHPRKELYRLLLRDNYGQRASLIDDAARRRMIEVLAEDPKPRYYKPRKREGIPTIREEPPSESANSIAAPRASSVNVGVRFAPPTPLSAGRRSVISALPGARAIPDTERRPAHSTWSLPSGASVTGGPSSNGTSAAPSGPAPTALGWTSYNFQAQQGPATTTVTVAAGVAPGSGDPDPDPPGSPDDVPPGWVGRILSRRNGRGGGNGGGGGDGSGGSGGGHGGLGPGGGAPGGYGGPPAAQGLDPLSASDQWQINPKLNVSVVPTWDGKGDSVIPYVITMSYLAALSPRMAAGVAQMAPYKFSGRAMKWWNNLSIPLRTQYSSDWAHLDAIRRHFLTTKWLLERTQEFEEMRFRQKGQEVEDPLDFFQRRIESHSFIFSDIGDGPQAVARILRTQPAEWSKDVNETSCPDVDTLQNYAEHNHASLIASWMLSNQVDTLLANGSSNKSNGYHRRRRALAADVQAGDENSSESEKGEEEGEDLKHAMAADQRRVGPKNSSNPKPPWPKGKTINGYEFKRDDSVVSLRLPNGECYICTSPKHYAHECPHHGRWTALKNAHLISTDIDAGDEAQDLREYIAMIVECKPTVEETPTSVKDSSRRREAFDNLKAKKKDKGKAVKGDDPLIIPRRQIRKSSHIAELASHVNQEGVTIHTARKLRQLPDGLGSLGARHFT